MIKKGGPGIFAERTHVALSLNIGDILEIGGLDKGLLGVDRSIWCTQVPTGAGSESGISSSVNLCFY